MDKKIFLALSFLMIATGGVLIWQTWCPSDIPVQTNIDQSICEKMQDQAEKDDCYWNIAEAKGDLSICDKIQFEYYKLLCYRKIAVAKKDLSICDNTYYEKDICYAEVAEAKQDLSICERISDRSNWKGYCYSKVATAKQDLSICLKIDDLWQKDACYADIAVAKQDSSICDKMSDQEAQFPTKDSCYADVAFAKQDLSICEKIQKQWNKDVCYASFAKSKQDSSICERIYGQTLKDACYRSVAQAKRDLSLCDKIQDLDDKNNCYIQVANVKSESPICTQEAKLCPDGSSVSRTGSNCEFSQCSDTSSDWKTYKNDQYGFELTILDSWKGYLVITDFWTGWTLPNYSVDIHGPGIIIRNPNWTTTQRWQDIPIMVFAKEEWGAIKTGNLAVSAAPVGPSKLGENQKYIFALPPRWSGFTDDLGQDEAWTIAHTLYAL